MDNNELNTATPVAPTAPVNAEEKENKLTNKKITLDEDPVYVDIKIDDDEAAGIIGKNGPVPASSPAPISSAPAAPAAPGMY